MTRSRVAWLAIAALLPPFAVAAGGGADLSPAAGLRVSWYDALAPGLALLGAIAVGALDPGDTRTRRGASLGALAFFGLVAVVSWSGGIRLGESVRITTAWRPALFGLVLAGLAAAGRRPRFAAGAARTLATGVALGALLAWGVVAADGAELLRRLSAAAGAGAASADASPLGVAPREPRRDVIFVLVDTLRADAVGAFGATPSPTPTIDALAARSVRFERAIAQAPWTFPSVAALFTGRHPTHLGIGPGAPAGDRLATLPALPEGVPRLAEQLRQHGWRTAGFVKNPFLGPGSGVETGFDLWELVGGDAADGESAAQLVNAALRWGRATARSRAEGARAPFFLYLHFMDPHVDYQPPDAFVPPEARAYRGAQDGSAKRMHRARRAPGGLSAEDVAFLRAMYRGEVAYFDSQLARLERELAALGLWRWDTVVVFTADHGEQFGEHGDYEHGDVHVENLRVPLIVGGDGVAPREVATTVRLVDVAPTLVDWLGLPPIPGAEGRSLAPLLRGDSLPPLPAVTEFGPRWRVTTDEHALLFGGSGAELFDTRVDPRERHDLASQDPAMVAALRRILDEHVAAAAHGAAAPAAAARPLDPALREQLKALGYLGR